QARHLQYCMEQYPDTGGIGPIFDSVCSNWNPNNVGKGLYVYGELPLFVTRLSGEVANRVMDCLTLPPVVGGNAVGLCLRLIGGESPDRIAQAVRQINNPGNDPTKNWTPTTIWITYNGVHLIGRTVSAIADLLALVFLFLIGRRLYNAWVGLLAAALYAAA